MAYLKCYLLTAVLIGFTVQVYAQTVEQASASSNTYTVPFASKGNQIELELANSTGELLKNISVEFDDSPAWIELETEQFKIDELAKDGTVFVSFSFDMKEKAPVGDTAYVKIIASNDLGFSWTTAFKVKVGAPDQFKLMSNYPNPFNPTTTIQYRLPMQMNIQVTVYNILGRKVATLADGVQQAGQHELRWNADNMASGLYFYRIIAEGNSGKQIIRQKKMMLIK